jgi:hypothetical protein
MNEKENELQMIPHNDPIHEKLKCTNFGSDYVYKG